MDKLNDKDREESVQEGKKKSFDIKAEIYDWVTCAVSALLFCVITFVFFARVIGVEGNSMLPTLNWYDKILVSNLFYTPKQGDIVIFRKESFRYEPLVKRVIATEGQEINIDASRGIVTVDGVVLDEDYIAEPTGKQADFIGPVTVPEGYVFVMGDNRNNSSDSRVAAIGFVDTRYIMGKVYFRIMPPSLFGSVYR